VKNLEKDLVSLLDLEQDHKFETSIFHPSPSQGDSLEQQQPKPQKKQNNYQPKGGKGGFKGMSLE
jgi:hypothetical protein